MNISVIGIGRLGLCMALCFENNGYPVVGVDTNEDYINQINNKTLKSYEPGVEKYLQMARKLKATTSLEEGLSNADLIFIVVPTPNGEGTNHYDHSILIKVLESINQLKVRDKHFVISCTVMPGFISKIGKGLLSDCEGCTLNYNPEFIAQGSIINNFINPDIVLIGEENKKAGDLIQKIYFSVTNCKKVHRLSVLEAEIAKISLNGFVTTKIAYANLIGDLCLSMGITNPESVLKAISDDSRIGGKYFKYGYSFSGPCFCRDLLALSQTMKESGIFPALPMGTHQSNQEHIQFQANQLLKEDKKEYTFTDICYKPESKIPIIEHSAKLKIAEILAKNGRKVIIKDEPQLINLAKKEYDDIFEYQIISK